MKIVNCTFTTRKGGLEQVFLDYNDALTKGGHEVISIVDPKSAILHEINTKIHKVRNFSKHDPLAMVKLWWIIMQENPDVIITHGNRAHYLMNLIARSIPVAGVAHGESFDYIKSCDFIITITKDLKQKLKATGYNLQRIFLLPNTIKISAEPKFKPYPLGRDIIIGAIGRLEKVKGFEYFINSIALLKKGSFNVRVKIAGRGPEEENLKKLVTDLGLNDSVEFLGWIGNKEEFFRSIDLLCVPSTYEPFGLVILEAFAYCTPLIVTNLPGPMEIVEDRNCALVCRASDAEDIASKLKLLFANEDLYEKLQKNAWERLKDFDFKQLTSKLTGIVTKIHHEHRIE